MRFGWSLDRKSWKELESLNKKLIWSYVPFDSSHAPSVPEKPGVYIICSNPPIDSEEPHKRIYGVLYAGRSEANIRARFKTHCSSPERSILEAIACYGYNKSKLHYYYATASSEKVAEIEYLLIKCYGPPANRQAGDKTRIPAKISLDKVRPAG